MKKKTKETDDAIILRQKAEQLLKKKYSLKTPNITDGAQLNRCEADTIKLLYELEVHQIELEMQNDELQLTKEKAEINAQKYTNLYDFAPFCYFTLNSEFKICKLNFNGGKLLGKERSKLINRNFTMFITLENRTLFINFLNKVAETKTKQICEVQLSIRENPLIFVHLEAIFLELEQIFLLTIVDITERKQIEEALKESEKIAKAATKTKAEFLANMSHEIRTPLNGVIGFTDLLLTTGLTSSQKEFAANANISSKALLGIISDILDFSKIEAGKMELDIVNSPITEILEQAIDIVQFSACKKGLDVILNIPFNFPERAMVDPLRLKQILLNLLNNAVKFTEEGEIELSVTFTPYDENSGRFDFSVKDTGIGFSDQDSKCLFKAFSQADGSITRKYGGTGLGLVISNYFATKMGSPIAFISEEGTGSEFYFTIDTDYEENPTNRKDIFKGTKVLIADHNSSLMQVISNRFKYWGIENTLVSDLNAIKENTLSNNYDALIIYERLINKSDYLFLNEHLSKNKVNNQKTSIVISYCPYDISGVVHLSKQVNVDYLITKPLITADLFECIKGICTKDTISSRYSKPAKISIIPIESGKRIKVLIAEDVKMNMILIRTLVKKIIPRVELFEAKNGLEAVELFKKKSPDLILMDIQMPELDGLGATKAIKKLESNQGTNIPIIALTAGAFAEDKEKCLNAGMVAFLTKPISIKVLSNVLRKYLSDKHLTGNEAF